MTNRTCRIARIGWVWCGVLTCALGSSDALGQTASLPEANGPVGTAPKSLEVARLDVVFPGETPTLERVLALASERAPEVAVARAELEASRSVAVGARVLPLQNPYLEVIAERGGKGVTRDVYVTAQLHTPIEFAGQRGKRIAEAQSFVEWNAASFELMRARVSGAVVQSYGECVTLAARYETLAELLASAQTEATVLGARRDAGDATERDAQLAELERSRIAVQIDETLASLGAALNELARLTGRRFGAPGRDISFPRVDVNVLSNSSAPAAPLVLGAEAEARYYARVDERLHRERLPPISVILQGGRGDFGETRLGAGLAWSLPAFRYNQGERARAQADAQRARSTASAMKSSISQRLAAIAQEGVQLRTAVERLDRDAIPAAELATESATRMQRAGKTDLLSVVVARRDFYVLRLRRHELALRAWELLGEWVELTGRVPR
ncbi:MAG: TolC family protein [Polyangiaceae bacterium]